MAAWEWMIGTLRAYPELAVFLALAFGFWLGPKKLAGFSLGAVTVTLLAGVAIGQFGIAVPGPIKSAFFLLFLFAVGYGVGPQFFAGLSKDGPRQNQINRLGLSPERAKAYADAIPIGYAVTYIFGTIGSAILMATVGPKLLGIDLPKACAEYERELGGGVAGLDPGAIAAYRDVELRAYRVDEKCGWAGKPARILLPGLRVFIERMRRDDGILDADADTVLQAGDVVAISGRRAFLVEDVETLVTEVDDRELLNMPAEVLDVFVTSKEVNGKTVAQLGALPDARGLYLTRIVRNLDEIPVLPGTEILRGDVLRIGGAKRHVEAAVKLPGYADRPVEATDLMTVAAGIFVGGLIGAISMKIGGVPISLSTSGGALLASLLLGYSWRWRCAHCAEPPVGCGTRRLTRTTDPNTIRTARLN